MRVTDGNRRRGDVVIASFPALGAYRRLLRGEMTIQEYAALTAKDLRRTERVLRRPRLTAKDLRRPRQQHEESIMSSLFKKITALWHRLTGKKRTVDTGAP